MKQRSLELEGDAEDSDDNVSQSEVADVQVDHGVHSPSRRWNDENIVTSKSNGEY